MKTSDTKETPKNPKFTREKQVHIDEFQKMVGKLLRGSRDENIKKKKRAEGSLAKNTD